MVCASWFKKNGDRNWSNLPQSTSDARAAVHFNRNWSIFIPAHTFCHSAIFHKNTPEIFGFSESVVYHFSKKWKHFRGRFRDILGNVWKLEWSKIPIDHKNALVFYQTVSGLLPEVFLTGELNTNKEKQLLSISSSRFWPFEEKNNVFSATFRVPIFDPALVQ